MSEATRTENVTPKPYDLEAHYQELEQKITAAGIRHYEAPLHRRTLSDMRRSLAVLREVIRTEKPDVVHAHARIPAFLCGRLQKSMGFPFVTSCHGVYQVSGALRLLSNWGDRTLAVSEDIRDYLMKEYRIPSGHITITINGNSYPRMRTFYCFIQFFLLYQSFSYYLPRNVHSLS